MKQILKDCKSIIVKKIGIICILLSCILIGIAVLWGRDILALCSGPKEFSSVESILLEGKENDDIAHAYVETEVEMITGSYAEYQTQGSREVYYLMPLQNGTYFMSIIADAAYIPALDEMEAAFYDSIGKEENVYPEPIIIQGGFRRLNEEEKSYALDFFTGYDEEVTTIDEISKILSPYALEIGSVGTVPIDHLWTILVLWILLLLIFVIFIILYASNFFLRTFQDDIKHLPEDCLEHIEEDYKEAKELAHSKFGKRMLYKMDTYTMRVFSYEQFIWLYKKEVLDKNKRNIQVYAYTLLGKQIVLYQSTSEKEAEKYLQALFDHCKSAILGYQEYLYDIWKQHPRQLSVKIKELQNAAKPVEKKKKEKKTCEEAGKKETQKLKKRKVLQENSEIKEVKTTKEAEKTNTAEEKS